jgi:dnd system-associated protein 4
LSSDSSGAPRDLSIDESNRENLELLVQSEHSPYWKKSMKDVFLVSAALGFYNGERTPLKRKKSTIPRSVLSDQEMWLLKSIAVSEKRELEILANMKEVLEIAEEYADSGITILRDIVFAGAPGDPSKRLELEARSALEQSKRIVNDQMDDERPNGKTPREDKEEYLIMSDFENSLRQLIRKKLPEVSSNWWKERIPEDVREYAERIMESERKKSPWLRGAGQDPLDYVCFPDYVKIITGGGNWETSFKEIFKQKGQIESKLKELEPVRNSLSHSRKLTKDQRDVLTLYTSQILSLIREAESEKP